MLGKVKGYQIKTIFKPMAKKDGFGLTETNDMERQEQQREVLSVLKDGGHAFGIYKKKELMACYVFRKEKVTESEIPYPKYDINKENAWDFVTGHELKEMVEWEKELSDKQVSIYRLAKVYNKSVPTDVLEEFEKAIITEFKELVMLDEVKAVIWNDKILTAKRVKVGADRYISAIPLGMSVGLLFGVVFDNIPIGLCFGVAWGLIFGVIFTATGRNEQEEMM